MQNQFQTQTKLSEQDFLAFGLNHIAYVRALTGEQAGLVGVFAADGTQVAVLPSREIAFAAIKQNDMEPLHVH